MTSLVARSDKPVVACTADLQRSDGDGTVAREMTVQSLSYPINTTSVCSTNSCVYTACNIEHRERRSETPTTANLTVAVARRNGSGATAPLAAVLAVSQLLLLATHSAACGGGYSPCPKPPPVPAPSGTGSQSRCPVNALKLGACASVLGGLLSLEVGQQAGSSSSSSPTTTQQPCCQLLGGLADLDAAACLCTALRANVLGLVQLSIPVQLSVVVNSCGKKLPQGFQCTT